MSKYDRLFQDPCKIANKLVTQDSGTGEPLRGVRPLPPSLSVQCITLSPRVERGCRQGR
ncbi:unnamed protein product [Ascophyllum nodosum]